MTPGDGPSRATILPEEKPVSADESLGRIYEEVAFVAYHFGWGHETVLTMPHWERRRWCREISRINEPISGEAIR